jgi:hypothetical protein
VEGECQATGKRFSAVRGSSILELEAGKIRRESDYWDAATLMKQVGLLPSQSGSTKERLAKEAIAVVRRNTEEVQGRGDFELFERLFAPGFVDHTPQRGFGADKEAVRALYRAMRTAFPDFQPEMQTGEDCNERPRSLALLPMGADPCSLLSPQ